MYYRELQGALAQHAYFNEKESRGFEMEWLIYFCGVLRSIMLHFMVLPSILALHEISQVTVNILKNRPHTGISLNWTTSIQNNLVLEVRGHILYYIYIYIYTVCMCVCMCCGMASVPACNLRFWYGISEEEQCNIN